MEKLVLVTYDQYKRLLGAQSIQHSTPDSMTPTKRKTMPQFTTEKRNIPHQKRLGRGPSMQIYMVKDWISF